MNESPTVTRLQDNFCDNLIRGGGNVFDRSLKENEVLQLVERDGQLDSVQELGKCNSTAATLRTTANRLYRERQFDDALICYAIQQFVKRYTHLHPQEKDLGEVLRLYQCALRKVDREGNLALCRARLQEKFVEL